MLFVDKAKELTDHWFQYKGIILFYKYLISPLSERNVQAAAQSPPLCLEQWLIIESRQGDNFGKSETK